MKTENIPRNKTISWGPREKVINSESKETKPQKDTAVEKERKLEQQPSKRIELDKAVINNPEAVQKLIGDSIQWRDMRFYQREEGGQYYIDIVDRATGNVIRTIPDTKFADVVEKYKQLSGLKINING